MKDALLRRSIEREMKKKAAETRAFLAYRASLLGSYCAAGKHDICGGLICGCSCHSQKPQGKACPSCGAALELVKASEGGMIETPFVRPNPLRSAEPERRLRPASFWACPSCEHCEEA